MTKALYNDYVRVCKEKGVSPTPYKALTRHLEQPKKEKKAKRKSARRKKDELLEDELNGLEELE